MQTITAEVITIGDEILIGQITDTNTQWISAELSKIGVKTVRKTSLGDTQDAILGILQEINTRKPSIAILTGGLGPTKDDITKTMLCQFFGTTLVENAAALAIITDFFAKRGREVTEINRKQAEIPANCTYIPNPVGTASGMWFTMDSTILISLPGVPFEMKTIMAESILPKLSENLSLPTIQHRTIRTIGIGESYLAEKIEDWENALPQHLKLAYLPSVGQVRLRLSGQGNAAENLKNEIATQVKELYSLIGSHIFGEDNDEIETVVAKLLLQKNATIATAESCTGGYLSHLFTKQAGSSAYFMGGIISYSNDVKAAILQVSSSTLQEHGAVSQQTVQEMATNVRQKLKTTIGIATTGIAGPAGGTFQKPVGTVWIAVATPREIISRKLQLGGNREQNIQLTAMYLLNLLRKILLHESVA